MVGPIVGLVGLVSVGLSLIMVLAWFVQRRTGNGGWVDAVWSFGMGLAGLAYALGPAAGPIGPRRLLIAGAVLVWSLRLGLHLAERSRRGPEDARYAQLRTDWGPAFEWRMFWFLQVQALAAAVLALTFLAAADNPNPLGWGDAVGLAIILAGLLGEAVADAQLRRFRADPAHRHGICDTGLWGLSRHPNYFFEWLAWLAYPCFAIGADYRLGWLALVGPAVMYWLLVHVSGIPLLEQQMLRSRGEAFRSYQARTRAFLPLPRFTAS